MKKIGFYLRGETYGWLSNFERSEQVVDGVTYPTNEHYYQSMKTDDELIADWIASAPGPHCAMIAGRGLREKDTVWDWDNIKTVIMKKGLRAKFRNSKLRKKLLETKDAQIFENSQSDMFWGVCGKNMLGKLIMEIRDEIGGEKDEGDNNK